MSSEQRSYPPTNTSSHPLSTHPSSQHFLLHLLLISIAVHLSPMFSFSCLCLYPPHPSPLLSSLLFSSSCLQVSSERKTERPAWAVAGTARGPLAPIDRILTEKTTPSFGLCLPWNPDTPHAGGDAGNKVTRHRQHIHTCSHFVPFYIPSISCLIPGGTLATR